jgi:hypothetical protein
VWSAETTTVSLRHFPTRQDVHPAAQFHTCWYKNFIQLAKIQTKSL